MAVSKCLGCVVEIFDDPMVVALTGPHMRLVQKHDMN